MKNINNISIIVEKIVFKYFTVENTIVFKNKVILYTSTYNFQSIKATKSKTKTFKTILNAKNQNIEQQNLN